MKLSIIFSLVLIFLTSTSSCNKNRRHPVPSIPFDISININLPSYSNLTGVGGYAYVQGGSKGIVVYRRSTYEFVAFDRHSPANDGTCEDPLVTNDDNFLQLDDLCTGATFSLYDGSPLSGSDFGLRMYVTVFDGNSELRIYN
ncbi:hypothetical protein G5B10_09790 [Fluviicola sp. SGL-29]|nr:hypothetical protein [Fluviicola sp. SGL-29]